MAKNTRVPLEHTEYMRRLDEVEVKLRDAVIAMYPEEEGSFTDVFLLYNALLVVTCDAGHFLELDLAEVIRDMTQVFSKGEVAMGAVIATELTPPDEVN
jgi:hypothetical protein